MGIWIDLREAFIVRAKDREVIAHLKSDVEDTKLGGGYGGSTKYAGQDASSQTKLTNRRNQQIDEYLEKVISALPADCESLYIFGPGETKKHLETAVQKDANTKATVKAVQAADSMTENQITEKVQKAFE